MTSMHELLHKSIPLWQVATLLSVIGIGATLLHAGGCCKNEVLVSDMSPSVQPLVSDAAATSEDSANVGSKEDKTEIEQECGTYSEDDEDDEDDTPFNTDWLFPDEPYPIVDDYTKEDGPSKLVLCVNMELKMGKGKIAAQCGHATLGAYKLARKYCKTGLNNWENSGTTKIAVKVEKESEFDELVAKAKLSGIVCHIVEDAGRTQIAAGSHTVLALGPAPQSILNQISGHLKLL